MPEQIVDNYKKETVSLAMAAPCLCVQPGDLASVLGGLLQSAQHQRLSELDDEASTKLLLSDDVIADEEVTMRRH